MSRSGININHLRAALVLLLFGLALPAVLADLDINAIVGQVTIDGSPAPGGTELRFQDLTNGAIIYSQVDGPNVPPFLWGEGRYDTGDIPEFDTGDTVMLMVNNPSFEGSAWGLLSTGTTTINLEVWPGTPPVIEDIPVQEGLEDIPWFLDLEGYVWDPDGPKASLIIEEDSIYANVSGFLITFLYPEGVLFEEVTLSVSDGRATTRKSFEVNVTPVNDPPRLLALPEVYFVQGKSASLDPEEFTEDPDNNLSELVWSCPEPGEIEVTIDPDGALIFRSEEWTGNGNLLLRVEDPGGLFDLKNLSVSVEPDLSKLIESLEESLSQLLDEKATLEEAYNLIMSDLDELKELKPSLERQISSLEALVEALQEEKADLQAEVDRLGNELTDEKETRKYLEEIVNFLEERNSTLALELQTRSLEMSKLRDELNAISDELEMARTVPNTTQYQVNMQRLHMKVILLQSEIGVRIQDLNEMEQEIETLRDYNSELQSEAESGSEDLSYLLEETRRFSGMIEGLLGEKHRLATLLTELEGEYDLLASRVNLSVATEANRVEPRPGDSRWTLLAIFVVFLFFIVLGSGIVYPRPRKPRIGFFDRK